MSLDSPTVLQAAANVEAHARIVAQKFIQRELIRISGETIEAAFEDTTDVFDLLDRSEQQLFEVAEGNIRQAIKKWGRSFDRSSKASTRPVSTRTGVVVCPPASMPSTSSPVVGNGLTWLLLAPVPGMGKTAFVLSMARNMAVDHDVPVAVFSWR